MVLVVRGHAVRDTQLPVSPALPCGLTAMTIRVPSRTFHASRVPRWG